MSKNTTNNTVNKSSMQLTQAQKEKFLEYLEKKGLPAPKGSESSLLDKIKDIFGWCVDDIANQMAQNNEEIRSKSNLEIEEIKDGLAKKIFNQAITMTVADNHEYDSVLIQELNESEDFKEIVFKLALYADTYPDFAYKFHVNALTAYIQICIQYRMKPDDTLVSLNEFLLSK